MSAVAEYTFVATTARPVMRKNHETGEETPTGEVFRAGQRYKLNNDHPFLKQWLADRVCYPSGQEPPSAPPHVPPFISSTLTRAPQEITWENERIERITDRVLERVESRLAGKGLFARLVEKLLGKAA